MGLKDIKGEIHIYKLEFGDGSRQIDNFEKHRRMLLSRDSLDQIYVKTYSFANTLMGLAKIEEPIEILSRLQEGNSGDSIE